MAEWKQNFTSPTNLNQGYEYTQDSNVTLDTFNVANNNAFYAVNQSQTAIDIANASNELVKELENKVADSLGTTIEVAGEIKSKVDFTSDPQTQIDTEITNRTNADNVLQSLINQKLNISKIKQGNGTFKFVAGNGTKLVHTWNAPATGYLIFYFGTWYGSERIKQVGIAQDIRPVVGTETMVSISAAPIGVTFFGRVNAGNAINLYTTSETSWGGENTGYIRYLLLED